MLAGVGAIFTLGVDQIAHHVIIRIHDTSCGQQIQIEEEAEKEDVEIAIEKDKYIAGKCEHKCDHQHSHEIVATTDPDSQNMVKAWIMEAAVAVHSVIIGFGFGILTQQEVGTIKILTTAFSIHQFFEGISLGSTVQDGLFNKYTTAKFALIFASTFPVGAIIGIIIKSAESNTESDSAILTQGVANALAAGILLHTALCEMIPGDFESSHHHHAPHQPLQPNQSKLVTPKGVLKFGMYTSLSIGFAVMAILALWA